MKGATSKKKNIFKDINLKQTILKEEIMKNTKTFRTSQSNQNSHSKTNILKQQSKIYLKIL